MAFFGANGAGKTNVLEALCLLTGRPDTLLRARERIIATCRTLLTVDQIWRSAR